MEVIPARPYSTLVERVGVIGSDYSQFAERLDDLEDTVANSFQSQSPVSPHLDLIVQTFASSKWQDMSSHCHSTNLAPALRHKFISGLPWLEEIHSRIWSRKALERDLFRMVKVTQAHYDELEKRLNDQHPYRNLPGYNGAKSDACDVQSIKLDVLRSTFPEKLRHHDSNEDRVDDDDYPEASNEGGSEMHVDDPQAIDEDGSPINMVSSLTLNFLDLSSLNLKEEPPRGLPLTMFLRREYDHISALIEERPRNGYGSVVVSGQPGTGELLVSLSHRI